MKYSNERRNDPVMRQKVREVHELRQKQMEEATVLLKQVVEVLRKGSGYEHDDIYDRNFSKVQIAYNSLKRDTEFMRGIGGETYIGNLAAGPLGAQLERMV